MIRISSGKWPLAENIFIGVDGGGTKTIVRVENNAGQLLGQAIGGPANIRLSVDQSWQSIYRALNDVLESAEISLDNKKYCFHIGLGLAGCEVSEAVRAFLSKPHPFSTIRLTSDAHVACIGAHQEKDGAIIIVGTGVIGYATQRGKSTQVGGWGFPHDDEGGAAWLGLEAVRLTFQWLDRRRKKSPLLEEVFCFFEQNSEKFTAWANRANSTEFARLAPLVIQSVQQEDALAIHLIKKAARAVDRIGVTLLQLQNEKLPCSLFGGLASFIEPWLCDELQTCLVPRYADANVGAIFMIRREVNQT